jgi:hypothetical protein
MRRACHQVSRVSRTRVSEAPPENCRTASRDTCRNASRSTLCTCTWGPRCTVCIWQHSLPLAVFVTDRLDTLQDIGMSNDIVLDTGTASVFICGMLIVPHGCRRRHRFGWLFLGHLQDTPPCRGGCIRLAAAFGRSGDAGELDRHRHVAPKQTFKRKNIVTSLLGPDEAFAGMRTLNRSVQSQRMRYLYISVHLEYTKSTPASFTFFPF